MTYDKNISVGNGRFCRGFRGVHVKVRRKTSIIDPAGKDIRH